MSSQVLGTDNEAVTCGSFRHTERNDTYRFRSWLNEHADFLAEPPNAALVRALVAAAAASSADGAALYQQLSAPQHAGVMTRLRQAAEDGQLCADADLDAVADALIGTLLLHALTHQAAKGLEARYMRFTGLLDAMLNGISSQ
jgi:hypothetical protein